MIIDAFLFFNELDLLRVRLDYLKDVVDEFVLVECNLNHNEGDHIPAFETHKAEFADYNIRHVLVTDLPRGGSNWDRVVHHRNAILRGLDGVPDDAIVLTSDLDEIPDIEVLKALAKGVACPDDGKVDVCTQRLYYYQPTCRNAAQDGYVWGGTRVTTAKTLRELTPQVVRNRCDATHKPGGWHFSYFGNPGFIRTKVHCIAETHDVVGMADMSEEAIAERVRAGKDLYNRESEQWEIVPLDDDMPLGIEQFIWSAS